MTNELVNQSVNPTTGEISQVGEQIISEGSDHVVVRDSEGKFRRKAKYQEYSSFVGETREDQMWLFNLINGGEDTGKTLMQSVGVEIEIQDIITRTYSQIDEKTGEVTGGVLTYLITPEREAYVTSSKGVYFTVQNIISVFGTPDSPQWENIKVKVGTERYGANTGVKITMVG